MSHGRVGRGGEGSVVVVDLGKRMGAVRLLKDQRVTIDKTRRITATVSWKAKDYDIYAVIRCKDGSERVCSTFGSRDQPVPTPVVGGIRHMGDVRGPGADGAAPSESLQIVMEDWVDQVAIVVYSARKNGPGSFQRNGVSVLVDNHAGTMVHIPAHQTNNSAWVFSCVPAILHNHPGGVEIEATEMYSAKTSEKRPSYVGQATTRWGKPLASTPGQLVMDAGSVNKYRKP